MIFSELYSVYYNAVARILTKSVNNELNGEELNKAVNDETFSESFMTIIPSLIGQKWQLLNEDFSTQILNPPTMPLTILQKRWLKAISLDPRIKLFNVEFEGLDDVEPLFTADDFIVFDKYADGDDYGDERYIENFRLILDSIRNNYPLAITVETGKGKRVFMNISADSLEYSEKDDKFRIITRDRGKATINVGRIISCKKYEGKNIKTEKRNINHNRYLVFELVDERNALERAMLHFAHFEKQTEKLDENRYKVTLKYDGDDETELVIRVLSFGPKIKVTEPESFVELIKDRLKRQKNMNL